MSVAGGGPDDGPAEGQETYTVPQAAKILRVTDRAVRKWLADGTLEGEQDASGRWHVPQRAVHARMEERPPKEREAPLEPREGPERVREYQERVEALQRELGRLEGRLELTERTESTMREERERLEQLLEEERAERRRVQEVLDAERSKGFWRRLFGG